VHTGIIDALKLKHDGKHLPSPRILIAMTLEQTVKGAM